MLLCSITLYAEHRFFPANSIRCTNAIVVNFTEMDRTIPRDSIYYDMWTGNDTIIDGKSYVTLWEQYDRDITTMYPRCKAFTPRLVGVIDEADNGYVYLSNASVSNDSWAFLYDFSSPSRKEGDTIYLGTNDWEEEVYRAIPRIDTCTLHNGDEIQVAYGLMYGIGYNDAPFFFPNYMWIAVNAYTPIHRPVNFYRNGESCCGVRHTICVAHLLLTKTIWPLMGRNGTSELPLLMKMFPTPLMYVCGLMVTPLSVISGTRNSTSRKLHDGRAVKRNLMWVIAVKMATNIIRMENCCSTSDYQANSMP